MSALGLARAGDADALRAGAQAGDPWAQLNLGAAYEHGMAGLAADPALSRHWYRQAAEQGLAEAQFNLAHSLATGHGGEKDEPAARRWFEAAAGQGMADAQFLLGVMLAEGLGGAVDRARAGYWLRQAAEAGQEDARRYLQRHDSE